MTADQKHPFKRQTLLAPNASNTYKQPSLFVLIEDRGKLLDKVPVCLERKGISSTH